MGMARTSVPLKFNYTLASPGQQRKNSTELPQCNLSGLSIQRWTTPPPWGSNLNIKFRNQKGFFPFGDSRA